MNQDNPFAKGVSINQDIVMEDETPTIIINTPHDIQETSWLMNEVVFEETNNQKLVDDACDSVLGANAKESLPSTGNLIGGKSLRDAMRRLSDELFVNDNDARNAELYANHPTLNRELLALGREEE